jgi:hypothetical protein
VRAVAALAALVVLAGCGAGPPEQEAAERAVAQMADTDQARCTARSRIWFSEREPANVFVCAVRVGDGFCDRYRVDRAGAHFRARLLERHGGCILPVG